jgi:hypothetical protein
MQIEALEDVLEDVLLWVKKCQTQLKGCLKHWGDDAESERLGWLLHYLADHEVKLTNALATFEEQANLGTQGTWHVEYFDEPPTFLREATAAPATGLSRLEIMQNIVQQHEQILALYQHLEPRLYRGHAQQLMFELAEMGYRPPVQMVNN